MNTRILALLSVLALASGCIVHNNNSNNNYYPARGNVTFSWTFAGGNCQATPDVASVTVEIPGQIIQPNSFACLNNGFPAITLTDFDGGDYPYTVTAYDSQGYALFVASGTFTVDGDVTVQVDLAPTSGANSYAWVSWGFGSAVHPESAPRCGTSAVGDYREIPNVKVTIDGVETLYNCTDGINGAAVQTGYLSAGQHSITVEAVYAGSDPSQDYVYAGATGTLFTETGAPTSQSFTLQWVVGGTAVNWTFYSTDGSINYPTCADAGVDTLRVNFFDLATQTYVYPDGDIFSCPADDSNLALYNGLPPGDYQVVVDAYSSAGGDLLYSNTADIPEPTVEAGVFVTAAQAYPTPIALDLQP